MEDELIWEHNSNKDLTVKEAYKFYSKKEPKRQWMGGLWEGLKIPTFAWKLAGERIPTVVSLK